MVPPKRRMLSLAVTFLAPNLLLHSSKLIVDLGLHQGHLTVGALLIEN